MAEDRAPRRGAGKGASEPDPQVGLTRDHCVAQSDRYDTPPLPTPSAEGDRYEILALLGTGGMGRVYKARDRQLGRLVALKFLRTEDAGQERRFLAEAQAQARVDHPNVCKVFDIGHLGQQPYIAMQFVDGTTLREARASLSLEQKLGVLRDVALGVHAAHRQGLIHRDLKPTNILVERDARGGVHPYVTDFGLAGEFGKAAPESQAGTPVGTPQYMPPEQARGDHAGLGPPSDVYALGATLYETLVGEPPFPGVSSLLALYRTLNEAPRSARSRNPALTEEVNQVAMRCLEKDPARRYPDAQALASDLEAVLAGEPLRGQEGGPARRTRRWIRKNRTLATAAALVIAGAAGFAILRVAAPEPVVVAVADFENQTGEEGLDGLSGLLITSLEQSSHLQILTRSRMHDLLRQMGKDDAPRIDEVVGRELASRAGARALLLATIRKFDTLYAIDLKVLDPATNVYVLAAREQGSGRGSVPGLIDKLAETARAGLRERGRDIRASQRNVAEATTVSLEAYSHYFRGQDHLDHLRIADALREQQEAVRLDPTFALGWVGLAYAQLWWHDVARSRASIERAFELPDRLPPKERLLAEALRAFVNGRGSEAYELYKTCVARYPTEKECVFSEGDVIFHGGYFGPAVDEFRRALALDPAMERAHEHLVWALQIQGKDKEMVAAARDEAARVDNATAAGHLGRAQMAAGALDDARATFQRALERFPQSPLPHADLASLDAWQGDIDGAVAHARAMTTPDRPAADRAGGDLVLGFALLQGGRVREALTAFESGADLAERAGQPELSSLIFAAQGLVHLLYLDDAAGAHRVLDEARRRVPPALNLAFVYPLLGDLAQYEALLRAAGDPATDLSVETFRARAGGDAQGAARGLAKLLDRSPYQDYVLYLLADAQATAHADGPAAATLERARRAVAPVGAPPLAGLSGAFRARADLQLSALYERLGEADRALEATQRFLKAWKAADPDRRELREARDRLARLHPPRQAPQR